MRLAELAIVLLVIAVPVGIAVLFWRTGEQRPLSGRRRTAAVRRASWRAETEVLDDRTLVVVRRSIASGAGEETLGRMVVAEVAAADPEWDVRMSQAMVDARVRAEILNAELRALP
jgi:hypothetical protein